VSLGPILDLEVPLIASLSGSHVTYPRLLP